MSVVLRVPRRDQNWSSDQDTTTQDLLTMQNLLQQRQVGKSTRAAKTIKAYSDALRTRHWKDTI